MLFADNLYSYQNQLVFISLDPFLTEVSRETGGGGGWGYCWNTAGVVWSFYPKHFVLTSPLSKNAEFSKKIHRFCQILDTFSRLMLFLIKSIKNRGGGFWDQ